MANMIRWKKDKHPHPFNMSNPQSWSCIHFNLQRSRCTLSTSSCSFVLQELSPLLGGKNLCRKSSSSQSEFCWNYRQWYCEENNRVGICWWSEAYKGMLTLVSTSWTKCSSFNDFKLFVIRGRITFHWKKIHKISTIIDHYKQFIQRTTVYSSIFKHLDPYSL